MTQILKIVFPKQIEVVYSCLVGMLDSFLFHSVPQKLDSLIPRLSRNVKMYRGESLVSFLRIQHDVIKKEPKQKGSVLHAVQPTMLQCSVCVILDARQLDLCSKLPATFALFPVLSLRVRPRTIKFSLPPLYLYHFSHEKKYQALHAYTTSMFAFRSIGAWERGQKLDIFLSNSLSTSLTSIY